MAADAKILWTHDLGEGRRLAMHRDCDGYRATLIGFCGKGSTQEIAVDDLLACMHDYAASSAELERSLAPGGHLHEQLRQIDQIVDQIEKQRTQEAR